MPHTVGPRVLVGTLTAFVLVCAAPAADEKPAEKPAPGQVEMKFADDSSLKLTLREEAIEITTPYGRLKVPFSEVRGIEFATRITPETAKKVDKLVADLASPEDKVREAAAAELLKHRDRAYPALLEAMKSTDADLKRRAGEVLDQLRDGVPEGQVLYRKYDTIQTDEMRISGKIEATAWKAKTTQFGEVEIKLTDLRGLKVPGVVDETVEVLNPQPDPGTLSAFGNLIGKKFAFRVTGQAGNGLYGTGTYTADSLLANAAVHTGVLKNGQTGIVRVEIVVPPPNYVGTTANGCASMNYGAYNAAYKILK